MFLPLNYNFSSPSFRVFKIPVNCDDFYASSKYILLNTNNSIKIFTHCQCKNIKLYKIIKHNLLLFINKKCIMDILYRIILSSVNFGHKSIEDIILYLKVDEILKVEEAIDGFLVTYKDKKKIFYNCNLEIEEKEDLNFIFPLKVNTLIKMKNRSIQIKKDEILIDGKSVECKKILKVIGDKEYLFVRNKEGIKAIIFN